MRYAQKTTVSSDKSVMEISRMLQRYGAKSFVHGWEEHGGYVAFEAKDRKIVFRLPLPPKSDFKKTETRRVTRSAGAQEKAYEQAVMQRWRALALVIKAKLEAVETGITEFEDEFMSHIVLPDGKTVGEHAKPMIEQAYSGRSVPLLPDYSKGR